MPSNPFRRFTIGSRWKSRFSGDSFTVRDIFLGESRMKVIWESAPNYIADIWSHELKVMMLVKHAE